MKIEDIFPGKRVIVMKMHNSSYAGQVGVVEKLVSLGRDSLRRERYGAVVDTGAPLTLAIDLGWLQDENDQNPI